MHEREIPSKRVPLTKWTANRWDLREPANTLSVQAYYNNKLRTDAAAMRNAVRLLSQPRAVSSIIYRNCINSNVTLMGGWGMVCLQPDRGAIALSFAKHH